MMEVKISIAGQELTEAQSMTVRVAVESFAQQLHTEGLGEDEIGKAICEGYLARICEIRVALASA